MVDSVVKLIDVLADGQVHSGEELGELLGVSRTAVWKQIQKLTELDLVVESIKGRGYCLDGGVELLNAEAIKSLLAAEAQQQLKRLDIFSTVDSTNSVARRCAEKEDATGWVVLAEQQTAGRGRRGRQWVSPYGRNLYLSVVWGFDGGAAALEGLSLAVGVAVKRAVTRCGVDDVTLKWPNDVLCNGAKLAGILLEMIGDPAGFCQVVIGVGINVSMPASQGEDIDQSWIDLSRASPETTLRNRVAACLLDELLPMLASYQQDGFTKYRQEWQACDAFQNKQVTLSTTNSAVTGFARGVSKSGAIALLVDGEMRYFNGGEVSLRGIE